MGIDGTVLIRCTRCKSKFRDRASRLRDGYSRQCPSCECMVFFLDGSPNTDIRDALREAEQVRKAMREEAADRVVVPTASAGRLHFGLEGRQMIESRSI